MQVLTVRAKHFQGADYFNECAIIKAAKEHFNTDAVFTGRDFKINQDFISVDGARYYRRDACKLLYQQWEKFALMSKMNDIVCKIKLFERPMVELEAYM